MNVIIANRYSSMLQTLDIDVIKRMEGEYTADELIATFQNFFFQRMILDITAIKNYKDIRVLQKLSISLNMEKVILLLDESEESSSASYLSKLISMGIYNFTKNVEGIVYLYNNPNSYRDVAQYHQLDNVMPQTQVVVEKFNPNSGNRIIGIKNVNQSAGATTFAYMMKKQLSKHYKVVALEVDKRDFHYFGEKNMVSTTSDELGNMIARYNDADIILVDMNNSVVAEGICKNVIYLLEPSMIKLNKLILTNKKVLANLRDKHVVLNQSLLGSKDVLDFEYEAKIKVFYNMPPLDEREDDIRALDPFLTKLGFDRQANGDASKKNKLLGFFNM